MALDLLTVFFGLVDVGFFLLLLIFFLFLEAESSPKIFFLDFFFFLTGRRCSDRQNSAQSANISSALLLHSLTLPLLLGATRKLRMRSTRSEWVPFFSRSRTVQTPFSLELVK